MSEEETSRELEFLKEKLETLEKENEKLRNDYLYLAAELDNLRKYMIKEIERTRRVAIEGILIKLINVYEAIEKATESYSEQQSPLLEGLKLIGKDVLKILEEAGVKRMEVVGKKFDPFLHEAVEQVEMENVEDGTIIEEVMKGYMLDDKVLRPPKVKVARSKKV
ncbi:MAG: nucleotide exchange factor GrpE [Thaumarchaeota archaeon]|jgi:molecular chaperone GrpE|nr:nucleotide exchange factor GrpE [Candidatus Terraquivivens yellowstonensis]MCL7393126.1 nucleotide exchange factor GrpE [Candidatus Terraquivivens yellowstonensis]MCL7394763.1 nucleotide exchange factor GrpE [Candidatus Terraquivivens yellowstonensis]MCL7397646.1 nucleotide exchange factor GrpE [Candidatus Terraquivivens yellowstonensis]MCL7400620.1 nucleotide exchange factor GrpE [Candidatus Terraquivivens yellowstonensis]